MEPTLESSRIDRLFKHPVIGPWLCALFHGNLRTAYLEYDGMYVRCRKCGIRI